MAKDISYVFKTLWKWRWLIISVVAVSVVSIGLGTSSSEPVYKAKLRVQISAPEREDVALLDQYRYASEREAVTLAGNIFIEVASSDEVYNRTRDLLNLTGNAANYSIDFTQIQDADLIEAGVEGENPKLIARILNTHVDITIEQIGELRSLSARQSKNHLGVQLSIADENLRIAEDTFTQFKTENGIGSLAAEISRNERLLEELQLQRDRILLDSNEVPPPKLALVDELIEARRATIQRLVLLEPENNLLEVNVLQARETHQLLSNKYTEATLKERFARTPNFVQVIEPANIPQLPLDNSKQMLLLTIIGSIGSSILLALLLEYLTAADNEPQPAIPVESTQSIIERLRAPKRTDAPALRKPPVSRELM